MKKKEKKREREVCPEPLESLSVALLAASALASNSSELEVFAPSLGRQPANPAPFAVANFVLKWPTFHSFWAERCSSALRAGRSSSEARQSRFFGGRFTAT